MSSNSKGISNFKKLDFFIHPAIEQSNINHQILDDADKLDNWTLEDYRLLTNWNEIRHDGWELPGTKESHYWCGQFAIRGCIHAKDHHQHEGKIFVQRFQRSCFRKKCETCYEKWIARQASTATQRMTFVLNKTDSTLSHVVLSIPQSDWKLSYDEMKKKGRQILSDIGIEGYALIFHPFRFLKKTMQWYFSPHFHLVGYGVIPMGRIREVYGRYGWIIKDLGPRKSLFSTLYYLLAHAGVKHRIHTLLWGGSLSYSKVKDIPKRKSAECPQCGRKLVELYFTGRESLLPIGMFEGFVDSENWHEQHYFQNPKPPTNYAYHSFAEVDSILESLANSL